MPHTYLDKEVLALQLTNLQLLDLRLGQSLRFLSADFDARLFVGLTLTLMRFFLVV